ncbi:MAG: hypothetical protein H6729_15550 [Deltaproteobacteria bacterium]|nr:hypothetical protein [Deltaproteobacteria bacterium]
MRTCFVGLAVGAVLSAGSACTNRDHEAKNVEHEPTTETRDSKPSALTIDNSLNMNGLYGNGLYVNGLSFNSYTANGLYVNGLPLNGLPLNGLYVNGLYVNGIGPNGLPVNGLPLNGLYVNGLPVNGLPVNGLPLNGLYVNGLPLNGLYVNGLPVNGLGLNGLPVNGLYVNELPLNGLYVNGLYVNGLYVNGLPLNGLPVNGLYVNGASPLTAIQVATTSGQLENLTADQEEAFESMMAHLMWCALPAGDSVTIYGSDGQPRAYPGHHGLAPTWKTAGLVDDPNGIDDSEELRWCLEHYRAIDNNNDVYPGIALNDQQLASLEKLLKYTVECALDSGESVDIDFPGGAKTFFGALGLAPAWKDGALDESGQKAVSACLAARTNAHGTTVRISLRNPAYAGLTTSALERNQFKSHEGAFWGNVFGSNPSIHACKAEGGGPAGRLCTDGSCGFTPDPIPSCNAPAEGGCDSVDAEGNFTSCGPDDEVVVLNTFLMTVKEIASSLEHTCARRHDGTIWCWGKNTSSQTGQAASERETAAGQVMGLPDPSEAMNQPINLVAGASSSCAQLRGGQLWCWGDNVYGQLGDDSGLALRATAGLVASLDDKVASVAAAGDHACAVKMDGTVMCWGKNDHGQLGDNSRNTAPVPVYATDHAVQVSLGTNFSCALKLDGSVWCWGQNASHQIGDSGTADELTPVELVAVGTDNIQLAAGGDHACVLKQDHSAACWGGNVTSQVGASSYTQVYPPIADQVANPILEISAGLQHTCALDDQGIVSCWGSNTYCQLSRFGPAGTSYQIPGILYNSAYPLVVMDEVVALQSDGRSNFVERTDGTVWGWGDDYFAQLGAGVEDQCRYNPVQMTAFIQDNDGVCDFSESAVRADCAVCGDAICAVTESCSACASDCEPPAHYADNDGDGYGDPASSAPMCGDFAGWVTNADDCNDASPNAFPGNTEVADALDNDCDGYTDEGFNLLTDPTFSSGVSDWVDDNRSLSYSTKNCYSSGGCAAISSRNESTIYTAAEVSGAVYITGRAFLRTGDRKGGASSASIEIAMYDSAGVLQYTISSSQAFLTTEYQQLSVTVEGSTNYTGRLHIRTYGDPVIVDNAELFFQPLY